MRDVKVPRLTCKDFGCDGGETRERGGKEAVLKEERNEEREDTKK